MYRNNKNKTWYFGHINSETDNFNYYLCQIIRHRKKIYSQDVKSTEEVQKISK